MVAPHSINNNFHWQNSFNLTGLLSFALFFTFFGSSL